MYHPGQGKVGQQGLTCCVFSSWAKFSPPPPPLPPSPLCGFGQLVQSVGDNPPSQSPLMGGGTAPPHLPHCWCRSSQSGKSEFISTTIHACSVSALPLSSSFFSPSVFFQYDVDFPKRYQAFRDELIGDIYRMVTRLVVHIGPLFIPTSCDDLFLQLPRMTAGLCYDDLTFWSRCSSPKPRWTLTWWHN